MKIEYICLNAFYCMHKDADRCTLAYKTKNAEFSCPYLEKRKKV